MLKPDATWACSSGFATLNPSYVPSTKDTLTAGKLSCALTHLIYNVYFASLKHTLNYFLRYQTKRAKTLYLINK